LSSPGTFHRHRQRRPLPSFEPMVSRGTAGALTTRSWEPLTLSSPGIFHRHRQKKTLPSFEPMVSRGTAGARLFPSRGDIAIRHYPTRGGSPREGIARATYPLGEGTKKETTNPEEMARKGEWGRGEGEGQRGGERGGRRSARGARGGRRSARGGEGRAKVSEGGRGEGEGQRGGRGEGAKEGRYRASNPWSLEVLPAL
jgi:hypothetical protein